MGKVGTALLLIGLLAMPAASSSLGTSGPQPASTSPLSSHWLAPSGCYRDELNRSDADYNNCWTDNAGKILATSAVTGDPVDGNRSLGFLEGRLDPSGRSYYLPELAVINGSVSPPARRGSSASLSNGLVELTADNATASHFDQLAVGTSYTGDTNLAYIGGDRIWFDNGPVSSSSSRVFSIADGFSKRSFFQAGGDSYYVVVNATLGRSDPYATVSIQLEPIGSSPLKAVEHLYLQAFNSTDTNPFFSGSLYSSDGSYAQGLGYRESRAVRPGLGGGILLGYSNATSVFSAPLAGGSVTGEDALAFKLGNGSVYDWEHWSEDAPFHHSWFGPGYTALQGAGGGSLTVPIYSQVYPILHFDYHLANDTARYVASSPRGVAVSPPVGFGFVSYGLALESSLDPSNATLASLARGYWNYYYSAYANAPDHLTPYARSIDLLALAGFRLYGCNSTVEAFARDSLGNSSGSSIEEYGWGAAASYALESCTGSQGDARLYGSFVNSFGTGSRDFVLISDPPRGRTDLDPGYSFQFGEAASGLMLGGVPYSSPVVLGAMDAVFQSDVAGTLLNRPRSGDLANTETIPALLLSVWLFQREMRAETGYWITSISRANVTSVDFADGTLLVGVQGNGGSISFMSGSSQAKQITGINGYQAYEIGSSATVSTKTVTAATTVVSVSAAACPGCVHPPLSYALVAALAALGILSLVLGYRVKKGRWTS